MLNENIFKTISKQIIKTIFSLHIIKLIEKINAYEVLKKLKQKCLKEIRQKDLSNYLKISVI